MKRLVLNFITDQLVETTFLHPLNPCSLHAVRGKSAGAFTSRGSFQWTSAVRALSLLCLGAASSHLRGQFDPPLLSGQRGSPAASLDYAIAKSPAWILEMFGSDSRGIPLAKRLFRISNPNQKRPGPVSLRLNEHFVPSNAIEIRIADIPVLSAQVLDQLIERVKRGDTETAAIDMSILAMRRQNFEPSGKN